MTRAVNQSGIGGEAVVSPLPDLPGVPLHERIKRWLSENILMGVWPPGSLVPGEQHLAAALGVAVGTVRRALADLVGEGLIHRRPRIGTVVTGRSPHHSLRFFYQYFRLHGLDGSLLRSRPAILAYATGPANEEEARALELASASEVVRIARLRRIDGRPVMHENLTIEAQRVPGLPGADAFPELFYLFLLDRYGLRITSVRESLWASLADARDRELLRLEAPAAVLSIDEVAYDQTGRPLILTARRAITDRYRYMNEVR